MAMATVLLACQSKHENTNKKSTHHSMDHADNSANVHMHTRSIGELIEDFESPERDAYQKPDQVLDLLGDISGMSIADIGAGSGYFTLRLADRGAQVIAADVNEKFLDHIKKRMEEEKRQNIELRKIPYDSPDLENAEVDKVLLVNTYHHIENRISYFSQVKAGTKTDGELVLVDFFKTKIPVGPTIDHKLSIDQVLAELKDAGYSQFDINANLLPYQYIIRAK